MQQISEIEEWDAILLQELSFHDEALQLDELEASLGGHKLVTNSECPWDTAIVIHRRWMGYVRWFSTSPHSVWVGIRADEEFTFCSAHLPSWVSDECFEQAVEEVLEIGKSKASGSIFVGIDANCNIDDNGDQRGLLVRELCALHNLLPLFQRFWTLAWQSPTGVTWKKKVDFCLTNQESAKVEIAENLHSRSDHKPLRVSRPHAQGAMLEFERKKKSMAGWCPQTSSQCHELHSALRKHVSLGASVGEIQLALETVMGDVTRAWECCTPEPLTETERRFIDARSRLKELTASTMLQGFNSSSLGQLSPREALVLHMVRRQKRLVNELRGKIASERKLEKLRTLGGKSVNKRLPAGLRNPEGVLVTDQSRWGDMIHEHFGAKFRRVNGQSHGTTRALWKARLRRAQQLGDKPGELSFEEFKEVLGLVKPKVATGRDNIPGTIIRFLPESVLNQLYRAIVDRLSGWEDAHVHSWAEFDICLVPKKGDISRLSNWRPISLVPTLYKVYEMCMWKVLDKELRPLPNQLVGFRPGMQCLDIVSFLVEALRKADEWGEKLFVVSMDVASAFDSVSAQLLGDVLLERGATVTTVAAAVRENLDLSARPCMGFTKGSPFDLEVGMRQGGPRTPCGWNQVMAVLVEELLLLWANRGPAVSWAPEWKPFEMLIWADNIFLVSSSIIDIVQRTQDIEHVFGKKELCFNQKSLEILPSKNAENEVARVWLNEKMEFSWVSELLVLGCHLDGSGSTETLVLKRLEQGRKMFFRTRCLLCCPKIPEEERLRTFYSTVVPCVLWGSGCWVPSAKIQQLLSFQENRWLRCMLGGRKDQDVAWVDWFRATKRATHALRTKMNLPSLWHRTLAAMHGWAGHVARKDVSHPGHAAILWRNARWWEIMKSIGAGSRDHSWRHRKRNWVRSFEHGLSKILGIGWWEVAKRDRDSWKEGKYRFICDAVRRWGGPRPLWKKAFVDCLAVSSMLVSSEM